MERFERRPGESFWAAIRKAKADPKALDDFVWHYAPALIAYHQSRGLCRDKAEKAAGALYDELLEDGFLDRSEQSKLNFRCVMLSLAARRTASNDLRDADFDREWTINLMQLGIERLSREDRTLFDVLKLFLTDSPLEKITEKIGRSENDVKALYRRPRLRLAQYLREEIALYMSQDGLEAELAYLQTYLS